MSQAANGNVVALGDHPRAKARFSAQESASVLSDCRDPALGRRATRRGGWPDRVEADFFALPEKAKDREARGVYLDARPQARENRRSIESTFRQHFVDCFNQKVRG